MRSAGVRSVEVRLTWEGTSLIAVISELLGEGRFRGVGFESGHV